MSLGGSGSDIGQAVKVDQDGNRYVTGDFSATAYFPVKGVVPASGAGGGTQPAPKSLISQGGTDIFLAKYDRQGNLLWLIQDGGVEDDEGFDLGFDASGNAYMSGVFTDSATFRGTSGAQTTVTGTGQTIFLAKYTPAGVLAWVQTGQTDFDSSNNGFGVAVQPAAESVYVAGVSGGDTAFSSSDGSTHTVPGAGTWHMILVKYDTDGHFRWGETNEASPNSVAHKIAVDANDNVYATGWMEGQVTFHSLDGHDQTVNGFSQPVQSFPDYPGDAYIVKYDRNGNLKWVNHIGGYKAIGTDIAINSEGKVSITGHVGNIPDSPQQASTIVTSQPGGNNINLGGGTFTTPFNRDVFVATYNGSGLLLNAQRYGGAPDEGGSGIAYDHTDSLIVAGIFQDKIKIAGTTLTGKDPTNLFVVKFGSAGGTLKWAAEADGPGAGGVENDPRIGVSPLGNIIVTGAYEPAAQFGSFKLNSVGQEDFFLSLLQVVP